MSEMPKPEEEKKEVLTDKEREELAAKRAEENLKRLREFERHLKEAPKYQFNTNVFKKGVTFAKSEAEAVAKDEALVKELAQFLKEQAIPKLVRDLQAVEGVPTDSESLSQAFHSHGINLRYLGAVSEALADKELNHLKTLLEREALVRSARHLINAELRETSDTHLSAVVSHLLNLLVSPLPLVAKMDEGSIAYPVSHTAVLSSLESKSEKPS
jgi:protein TIF31